MGIGPRMIRCGRLDGNWDNSRMIQYRWDRREERKMRGVRLSWSLGDRRGRLGTEKSGMLLMYLMWIITFDCICMQQVNLHLAFVVICDCKTLRLAAESLSRRKSACIRTNRKSNGRAVSIALHERKVVQHGCNTCKTLQAFLVGRPSISAYFYLFNLRSSFRSCSWVVVTQQESRYSNIFWFFGPQFHTFSKHVSEVLETQI